MLPATNPLYEKGSVKVKENMIAADMKQLLNSMENTIKLQNRARAEKRADKAAQEQQEFKEKLMRLSTGELELESMARKGKGAEAAVQRDQLIGLMMAGF